jgi:hypothetical protein
MANITGQSINIEPMVLGFQGNHLTSMERYLKASGSKSKFNTLQRETADKGSFPMATTETLQRTVAQEPRKVVYSNGLMTAPLISGRATVSDNPEQRAKDELQGAEMVVGNTIRDYSNIPHLR